MDTIPVTNLASTHHSGWRAVHTPESAARGSKYMTTEIHDGVLPSHLKLYVMKATGEIVHSPHVRVEMHESKVIHNQITNNGIWSSADLVQT